MIIITKSKNYYWNYKILLNNLKGITISIFFIVAYLILSTMDAEVLR